ncbi:hypothetical protein NPS70_16360 [Streptomyces sp. C10-9-1]|uniref:hypothetical protein n=1 Tax=Streptomyces sp. C10-9-1 TaxID=1859285 RepID=UPI0021114C21|nr:hypothetical protein [Streptomyces sp. C10-9-1]MCQ6554759.1 hypothetical protein [Streptomyces sp. C10-9-1]
MGEQDFDSSDEHSRDDRIECYYQMWSARDMAERIVELEDDEMAASAVESDRIAALVARDAEIERLNGLVDGFNGWRASIYEVARCSFRAAEKHRRAAARYRLAWLSARRRA